MQTKILEIDASDHVTVNSPTSHFLGDINADGNIHANGQIIAGIGSSDQVGLQSHIHSQPTDSHGDFQPPTNPPTAGT